LNDCSLRFFNWENTKCTVNHMITMCIGAKLMTSAKYWIRCMASNVWLLNANHKNFLNIGIYSDFILQKHIQNYLTWI